MIRQSVLQRGHKARITAKDSGSAVRTKDLVGAPAAFVWALIRAWVAVFGRIRPSLRAGVFRLTCCWFQFCVAVVPLRLKLL